VLGGGGAIVSELLPDAQPRPHNVRSRNRVVAGLADVVVVVEGREASGSLVTAGVAADAGIEVLAVPGDVRAAGSAAPHQLLREGATPCAGPDDLLAALRLELAARTADTTPTSVSVLPAQVLALLSEAWPRPVRTEDLAGRSDLGLGVVLAAVTRARVAREVVETAQGVRLTRPPTTFSG
jgi:DNA processing protein